MYRQNSKAKYAQKRARRRTGVPKRNVLKQLALKPAGSWSQDLLENTDTGKILKKQHAKAVEQKLRNVKASSPQELNKIVEKVVLTPQQKFVILYEKSLREPLSPSEFTEYLTLLKDNFPALYKHLYGNKTPSQITAECIEPKKA